MTRNQTVSLAIAAVLAALAAGWMVGRAGHDEAAPAAADAPTAERRVLYYRNPMGLPDTSPVPKKDPMGMDYIPVYASDEPVSDAGTVALSPGKIQTLGVRTEPVRRSQLASLVRASGTVEIDETRQYAIAPRFEGWVEHLYANQTGMQVSAGQPLMAVYSPQLAAARQEFRLADAAARRLAQSDPASAASMERLREAARTRLQNWEISGAQLGGQGGSDNMVLTSPANAVVIEKPIIQGARFQPGETILRLADLSTVWIMAKVPAMQAADIAVGQPARFETETLPGQSFAGEVTFVQPVVDAASRTVDVRVALPNPTGDLRPNLFGTVLLEQPSRQPVLSVPRSAVLDSGARQTVLVQTGPGRFAPREVTIGRRAGDRIEILDGVAEGEEVVVSANFLIDAESNLKAALEGFGAASEETGATGPSAPSEAPHASHETRSADPHAGHSPVPVTPPVADDGGASPHEGH
ncbi:efflux RND transporter periplasmic adaptor subunit [Novilysobacter arseniciresistens]|uniref:efflux RND transporter periplasmic adaptor subunit n=1 Tax=Novilysobacter arseniciresistens TaxID=1385522 RepID=UPI0009E06A77|nr:efflux RND transporter periplasmic adaptor subunit [Lysobacter arseniciresistens]